MQIVLHIDTTGDGVDDGIELREHGIAGVVHDPAVIAFHMRAQAIQILAEQPMRPFLVLTGQATVVDDVGVKNRGELPYQGLVAHGVLSVMAARLLVCRRAGGGWVQDIWPEDGFSPY